MKQGGEGKQTGRQCGKDRAGEQRKGTVEGEIERRNKNERKKENKANISSEQKDTNCVCVYVCVCMRARLRVCMCVHVRMRVCVRERERGGRASTQRSLPRKVINEGKCFCYQTTDS